MAHPSVRRRWSSLAKPRHFFLPSFIWLLTVITTRASNSSPRLASATHAKFCYLTFLPMLRLTAMFGWTRQIVLVSFGCTICKCGCPMARWSGNGSLEEIPCPPSPTSRISICWFQLHGTSQTVHCCCCMVMIPGWSYRLLKTCCKPYRKPVPGWRFVRGGPCLPITCRPVPRSISYRRRTSKPRHHSSKPRHYSSKKFSA